PDNPAGHHRPLVDIQPRARREHRVHRPHLPRSYSSSAEGSGQDAHAQKLTYALDGSSWGCPGASPVRLVVGLTKHQVSRRPAVPLHSRAAGSPTPIFMRGGEPQAPDDWWAGLMADRETLGDRRSGRPRRHPRVSRPETTDGPIERALRANR